MRLIPRFGLAALSLFFSLSVYPSFSTTIHVPADQPAIQDALEVARDGDLILVAPGTYFGCIDFIGKEVTVQSEEGADQTAFWGDHYFGPSAVTFANGETEGAVLDGFAIYFGIGTRFLYLELEYFVYGGGIYCAGASPTITNCTISWNDPWVYGSHYISWGGGIYIDPDSSPSITNCTISENEAHYGGGICCESDSATIENCTILLNEAYGCDYGGDGSGIAFISCSPTITNCEITRNSSDYNGGGIYCYDSSPVITSCRITGNDSNWGGGIYYWQSSSPTITNSVVSGNDADYGGGIYCYRSDATILYCTIGGNSAYKGGGIYCDHDSTMTLTNCILWGDSAPQGSELWIGTSAYHPSAITVSYSDVMGGEASAFVEMGSTMDWLEGNIDEDPLFVDPDGPDDLSGTEDDDYHLSMGSPCIDAGVDAGVYTDMDCDVRPQGTGYDMGADEFVPGACYLKIVLSTLNS